MRTARAVLLLLTVVVLGAGCAEKDSDEPGPTPSRVYEYGRVVTFGAAGDSRGYRTSGWADPESDYTWTNGPSASLTFQVAPAPADQPLNLVMTLGAFTAPPELMMQLVDVYANGEKIASWEIRNEDVTYTATIPASLTTRGSLNIDLHVPKATAPAELGLSDARRLGVRCLDLKIEPVAAEPAAP